MITIRRVLVLSLILLGTLVQLHAAEGLPQCISLNREHHTLVAPEALEYHWYYNGLELGETGSSIPVVAPGTYEVVMKGTDGQRTRASVTVGIDGEGEVFTIYILGDSTACDWDPKFYHPLTGWGQMLPYFFDSGVVIRNKAISARSAKSFYNDHWNPIRDSLKPGDLVFIQFGINDAKIDDTARYTDPFTTFQEYLTLFVTESQEKGALPVLVTTIRRNSWNDTDPPTLYPAYHDYPVATRELAGELGVSLIDIDQLAIPFLEALGPDYTGPFLYMNLEPNQYPRWSGGADDDVHLQEMGAIEMARIVAEAIEDAGEDTVLNRLIPHLTPWYEVATSTNFPEGAMITRTASYPEGVTVTLRAVVDTTYDLLEWQEAGGTTLGTADWIELTMGTEPLSVTAILDDDPQPDCAGVLNGSAYTDECGSCVGGTTGVVPCNLETPEGTYKLVSIRSDLCVQEGEEITQEECLQEPSQLWELIREGTEYKIRNKSSGQYLYSDTLASNTLVATGEMEMLWRLEKLGTDTFQISTKEDPSLVLEVYGMTKAGVPLRLYKRTGGLNQMFSFGADPTGLPESLSDESSCRIFPNPASVTTTLEFTAKPILPVTFELYNLQGQRLLYRTGITGDRVTFGEELKEGVYLVKISDGISVHTLKFVKNQR
jgi:lysophospholipase L1-like esterase